MLLDFSTWYVPCLPPQLCWHQRPYQCFKVLTPTLSSDRSGFSQAVSNRVQVCRLPHPMCLLDCPDSWQSYSVWIITITSKPLIHLNVSILCQIKMCFFLFIFYRPQFFALSVIALAVHSVALHAGILLSHDSPHPLMHSVVWGIHRFPGWLFLELICERMCAFAIWMTMSLTQSIGCTSSGTNFSNLSFDFVVPQNLVSCVSA